MEKTINKVMKRLASKGDIVRLNKIVKCCEHNNGTYYYKIGYLQFKLFKVMICTDCGAAVLICNGLTKLLFNLFKPFWNNEIYLFSSDKYRLMIKTTRSKYKYILVNNRLLDKLNMGE